MSVNDDEWMKHIDFDVLRGTKNQTTPAEVNKTLSEYVPIVNKNSRKRIRDLLKRNATTTRKSYIPHRIQKKIKQLDRLKRKNQSLAVNKATNIQDDSNSNSVADDGSKGGKNSDKNEEKTQVNKFSEYQDYNESDSRKSSENQHRDYTRKESYSLKTDASISSRDKRHTEKRNDTPESIDEMDCLSTEEQVNNKPSNKEQGNITPKLIEKNCLSTKEGDKKLFRKEQIKDYHLLKEKQDFEKNYILKNENLEAIVTKSTIMKETTLKSLKCMQSSHKKVETNNTGSSINKNSHSFPENSDENLEKISVTKETKKRTKKKKFTTISIQEARQRRIDRKMSLKLSKLTTKRPRYKTTIDDSLIGRFREGIKQFLGGKTLDNEDEFTAATFISTLYTINPSHVEEVFQKINKTYNAKLFNEIARDMEETGTMKQELAKEIDKEHIIIQERLAKEKLGITESQADTTDELQNPDSKYDVNYNDGKPPTEEEKQQIERAILDGYAPTIQTTLPTTIRISTTELETPTELVNNKTVIKKRFLNRKRLSTRKKSIHELMGITKVTLSHELLNTEEKTDFYGDYYYEYGDDGIRLRDLLVTETTKLKKHTQTTGIKYERKITADQNEIARVKKLRKELDLKYMLGSQADYYDEMKRIMDQKSMGKETKERIREEHMIRKYGGYRSDETQRLDIVETTTQTIPYPSVYENFTGSNIHPQRMPGELFTIPHVSESLPDNSYDQMIKNHNKKIIQNQSKASAERRTEEDEETNIEGQYKDILQHYLGHSKEGHIKAISDFIHEVGSNNTPEHNKTSTPKLISTKLQILKTKETPDSKTQGGIDNTVIPQSIEGPIKAFLSLNSSEMTVSSQTSVMDDEDKKIHAEMDKYIEEYAEKQKYMTTLQEEYSETVEESSKTKEASGKSPTQMTLPDTIKSLIKQQNVEEKDEDIEEMMKNKDQHFENILSNYLRNHPEASNTKTTKVILRGKSTKMISVTPYLSLDQLWNQQTRYYVPPFMSKEMFEDQCKIFLKILSKRGENELRRIDFEIRTKKNPHLNNLVSKNILTSKYFNDIILRRAKNPFGFVEHVLYVLTPKPEIDRVAIAKYQNITNKIVSYCGYFVDEEYPFLGAQPDGLTEENGIVKFINTSTYPNVNLKDILRFDKKLKYEFTVERDRVFLSPRSRLMYEIQGDLHIANRDFCDLLVYNGNEYHLERVQRNNDFWTSEMLKPLVDFYMRNMLPAVVKRTLQRRFKMYPTQLNYLLDENEDLLSLILGMRGNVTQQTIPKNPPTKSVLLTSMDKEEDQKEIIYDKMIHKGNVQKVKIKEHGETRKMIKKIYAKSSSEENVKRENNSKKNTKKGSGESASRRQKLIIPFSEKAQKQKSIEGKHAKSSSKEIVKRKKKLKITKAVNQVIQESASTRQKLNRASLGETHEQESSEKKYAKSSSEEIIKRKYRSKNNKQESQVSEKSASSRQILNRYSSEAHKQENTEKKYAKSKSKEMIKRKIKSKLKTKKWSRESEESASTRQKLNRPSSKEDRKQKITERKSVKSSSEKMINRKIKSKIKAKTWSRGSEESASKKQKRKQSIQSSEQYDTKTCSSESKDDISRRHKKSKLKTKSYTVESLLKNKKGKINQIRQHKSESTNENSEEISTKETFSMVKEMKQLSESKSSGESSSTKENVLRKSKIDTHKKIKGKYTSKKIKSDSSHSRSSSESAQSSRKSESEDVPRGRKRGKKRIRSKRDLFNLNDKEIQNIRGKRIKRNASSIEEIIREKSVAHDIFRKKRGSKPMSSYQITFENLESYKDTEYQPESYDHFASVFRDLPKAVAEKKAEPDMLVEFYKLGLIPKEEFVEIVRNKTREGKPWQRKYESERTLTIETENYSELVKCFNNEPMSGLSVSSKIDPEDYDKDDVCKHCMKSMGYGKPIDDTFFNKSVIFTADDVKRMKKEKIERKLSKIRSRKKKYRLQKKNNKYDFTDEKEDSFEQLYNETKRKTKRKSKTKNKKKKIVRLTLSDEVTTKKQKNTKTTPYYDPYNASHRSVRRHLFTEEYKLFVQHKNNIKRLYSSLERNQTNGSIFDRFYRHLRYKGEHPISFEYMSIQDGTFITTITTPSQDEHAETKEIIEKLAQKVISKTNDERKQMLDLLKGKLKPNEEKSNLNRRKRSITSKHLNNVLHLKGHEVSSRQKPYIMHQYVKRKIRSPNDQSVDDLLIDSKNLTSQELAEEEKLFENISEVTLLTTCEPFGPLKTIGRMIKIKLELMAKNPKYKHLPSSEREFILLKKTLKKYGENMTYLSVSISNSSENDHIDVEKREKENEDALQQILKEKEEEEDKFLNSESAKKSSKHEKNPKRTDKKINKGKNNRSIQSQKRADKKGNKTQQLSEKVIKKRGRPPKTNKTTAMKLRSKRSVKLKYHEYLENIKDSPHSRLSNFKVKSNGDDNLKSSKKNSSKKDDAITSTNLERKYKNIKNKRTYELTPKKQKHYSEDYNLKRSIKEKTKSRLSRQKESDFSLYEESDKKSKYSTEEEFLRPKGSEKGLTKTRKKVRKELDRTLESKSKRKNKKYKLNQSFTTEAGGYSIQSLLRKSEESKESESDSTNEQYKKRKSNNNYLETSDESIEPKPEDKREVQNQKRSIKKTFKKGEESKSDSISKIQKVKKLNKKKALKKTDESIESQSFQEKERSHRNIDSTLSRSTREKKRKNQNKESKSTRENERRRQNEESTESRSSREKKRKHQNKESKSTRENERRHQNEESTESRSSREKGRRHQNGESKSTRKKERTYRNEESLESKSVRKKKRKHRNEESTESKSIREKRRRHRNDDSTESKSTREKKRRHRNEDSIESKRSNSIRDKKRKHQNEESNSRAKDVHSSSNENELGKKKKQKKQDVKKNIRAEKRKLRRKRRKLMKLKNRTEANINLRKIRFNNKESIQNQNRSKEANITISKISKSLTTVLVSPLFTVKQKRWYKKLPTRDVESIFDHFENRYEEFIEKYNQNKSQTPLGKKALRKLEIIKEKEFNQQKMLQLEGKNNELSEEIASRRKKPWESGNSERDHTNRKQAWESDYETDESLDEEIDEDENKRSLIKKSENIHKNEQTDPTNPHTINHAVLKVYTEHKTHTTLELKEDMTKKDNKEESTAKEKMKSQLGISRADSTDAHTRSEVTTKEKLNILKAAKENKGATHSDAYMYDYSNLRPSSSEEEDKGEDTEENICPKIKQKFEN